MQRRRSCFHRPGAKLEVVWAVSLKLVAASVEESVLLLLPIPEKEENKNNTVVAANVEEKGGAFGGEG